MASIIVALSLVYLALFLVDGPSLVRRRRWRELAVYLLLLVMAAAFSSYWALVRPPTGLNYHIQKALEPLANIVLGPPEISP